MKWKNKKKYRGESFEQGQRSSEGDLISAGKQDAPENDDTGREYISKSESVGGKAKPQNPLAKVLCKSARKW